MAMELTTKSGVYGVGGGGTSTYNVSDTSSGSFNGDDFAIGSGQREATTVNPHGTLLWVWGKPQVTSIRNKDNSLTITKIVVNNLRFTYDSMGTPVGSTMFGLSGTYYTKSGNNWTQIYSLNQPYYIASEASHTTGLSPSTRTIWTGSRKVDVGESTTFDLAKFVASGNFTPGNADITIKNTYERPIPVPPTLEPNCVTDTKKAGTIKISTGGNYGECWKEKDSTTYKVYTDSAKTNLIKSGTTTSATISGLQNNKIYYVTWERSNGCLDVTASCSVATITPNTLSDPNATNYTAANVKLMVQYGSGAYNPKTAVYLRKCGTNTWGKVYDSTTTSVDTIRLTDLDANTCYEVKAETTTTAGTYVGNIVKFTTPEPNTATANITSITPYLPEDSVTACAKVCYQWETPVTPASGVLYYRPDGETTWNSIGLADFTTEKGSGCVEICNLLPNQTTYESYIETKTDEGNYSSSLETFITTLLPQTVSHLCENLDYMVKLICQAFKSLESGYRDIYANDCTKEQCDPYSPNPTYLTLWSRVLRYYHALGCALCGMGALNFTTGTHNQYYSAQIGWTDILDKVLEGNDPDSWRLVKSGAIYSYIESKLHEVWHTHGSVDYILNDMTNIPDNARNILNLSDSKIYSKVGNNWVVSTTILQPDNFSVYHINYGSVTNIGTIIPESAYYYFEGSWNLLDGDFEWILETIDALLEKANDNIVVTGNAEVNIGISVVDKDLYDCNKLPNNKRTIAYITEDMDLPAPTYYTVTFVSGDSGVQLQPQIVKAGSKAQEPIAPQASTDGKMFAGWSLTSGGTQYDWDTPVTSDITLYGSWANSPTSTKAKTPTPENVSLEISWNETRDVCSITASCPNAEILNLKVGTTPNSDDLGSLRVYRHETTINIEYPPHGNNNVLYIQSYPEDATNYIYTAQAIYQNVAVPNPILGVFTPKCTGDKKYIVDIIEKKTDNTCTGRWKQGVRVYRKRKCGSKGFIQQENGAYVLQEDNGRLELEE